MTTTSIAEVIRGRIDHIESMPAIPTIFLPLLDLLRLPPERVKLDEIVKLISYDNTIAAQCLRAANSPLFGLSRPPDSIKGAVMSLGLRKVETILLTCTLGNAFPAKNWILDPTTFWRHSLGCAMVCRKISEKLYAFDPEKAYMAGLLHDLGLLVNCIAFSKELAAAFTQANAGQMPFHEAELATMGFTHCETGRALAEKWHLPSDMIQVIACHHDPDLAASDRSLVALVHLADLLCRMRGMGYGFYENQKVDLAGDKAWEILLNEHRDLAKVDLVRFSFEMDDAIGEIFQLVSTIFGGTKAAAG